MPIAVTVVPAETADLVEMAELCVPVTAALVVERVTEAGT